MGLNQCEIVKLKTFVKPQFLFSQTSETFEISDH